ncbi:MAG TPA: cytochrome c biogenesis protein CcdA [bacterium]|nr:cytochrome c biogenesis protein CcdA [bacterium]HPG46426.1 cytochrome c biogenesis protein CcdA [bacterium]HPM98661.1 cytochrome c biogenesis protein CcdA [bacterium]
MNNLFVWLTESLSGSVAVAFLASLIWGILSIALSPCHLSSIPLIVGFINGQGVREKKRAFYLSALFAVGILFTIALIGLITGLLGRILGDIGKTANYVVAVIFFVMGLHLLEWIKLPFLAFANRPKMNKHGLWAAFLIGLLFGLALGPCTFAFMAPILGITFSIASTKPVFAVLLVLFYAIGHCSIIVLAGTFTGALQKALNWNERTKGALILKKTCGLLVILGGLYLIWSAF